MGFYFENNSKTLFFIEMNLTKTKILYLIE